MARVNPWFAGNFWQSTAINQLDAELERERSARVRQLIAQSAQRAAVDARIDGLGAQLDVVGSRSAEVVDWVELRLELLELAEYRARVLVRNAFRALRGGELPRPNLLDVPGYWLPPAAAAAVAEICAGSSYRAEADAGWEQARAMDPIRADLLAVAVSVLFQPVEPAEPALRRLMAAPMGLGLSEGVQVARAWRSIWELVGGGALGPAFVTTLRSRLVDHLDPAAVDAGELAAWDQAIRTFGSTPSGTLADALTALGGHLGQTIGTSGADEKIVGQEWNTILDELIEEPTSAEQPVLAAMADLHPPSANSRYRAPTWGSPTGTAAAIVRAHLFDADTPPALRRFAAELAGPLLRARTGELVRASQPAVGTVVRNYRTIEVTGSGYDADALAVVDREIRSMHPVGEPAAGGYVVAGIAVAGVACVAAVIGHWVLAVLVLCGVAIPVWRWQEAKGIAAEASARRDGRLAEVRTALRGTVAEIAAEDERRAEQLRRDRAAIERFLGTLPNGSSVRD